MIRTLATLAAFTSVAACKSTESQNSGIKTEYGEGFFTNKNVLFSQSYKSNPKLRCFFYGKITWGRNLKGIQNAESLCEKPFPDSFVQNHAGTAWRSLDEEPSKDKVTQETIYMLRDIASTPSRYDLNSGSYKGQYTELDINQRRVYYSKICSSLPKADLTCPLKFNGKKHLDADAEAWDINHPDVVPYEAQ